MPRKKIIKKTLKTIKVKKDIANDSKKTLKNNKEILDKKAFNYKRVVLMLCILVFFIIFISFFVLNFVKKSEAETAYLYPNACLGNWDGVANAQGQLQVSSDANFEDFNNENSAVYLEGDKQIFCSLFSGELENDIIVKKIKINLSWATNFVSDINVEQNTIFSPVENISISVEENDINNTNFVDTNIDNNNIDNINTQNISISSSSDDIVLEENSELVSTFLDDGSDILETKTDSFFIIKYSLDGSNWLTLANVKDVNIDKEFLLPVSASLDLKKLQISIESTANSQITYLDGMSLIVEYEKNGNILSPDFVNSDIVNIKSNEQYSVVLVDDFKNHTQSLWFYDRKMFFWNKIAEGDMLKDGTPIYLKDAYFFWLSPDSKALIGFSILSYNYFSGSIDRLDNDFGVDFGDFKIVHKDNNFFGLDSDGLQVISDDYNTYNEDIFSIFSLAKEKESENYIEKVEMESEYIYSEIEVLNSNNSSSNSYIIEDISENILENILLEDIIEETNNITSSVNLEESSNISLDDSIDNQ